MLWKIANKITIVEDSDWFYWLNLIIDAVSSFLSAPHIGGLGCIESKVNSGYI